MKVVDSVQDLIGHTPLVRIRSFSLPPHVRLYAKLEMLNPGGSVKDRLGMALIRAGEESGQLKPGGTIVEPTAGNTGIGLALAAIGKGYRVIFTVPEKFSMEKQQLMRALGAEIVHTPTEQGMRGAIERAKQLAREIPGAYCPLQFANPANPEAHYRTTGPEIWEQTGGRIDTFVCGAGSGGTFMGVARYLKEQRQDVKTVIVEPEGSILNGGEPGPHRTEGIGMEFLPEFMDRSYFDRIYTIPDDEAFAYVKKLARQEGLLVGSSSGAAFAAALKEAEQAEGERCIVVIFPDSSERYLTQDIYDFKKEGDT